LSSDVGVSPLPLEAWHLARGARLVERGGCRVPVDYGDPAAEERAVRDGCGLVDRSAIARLELLGADRGRFLHGLLTVDVRTLEAGRGIYGFATGPKGQVLADVVVHALGDRLWLELPPGREDELRRHLERYVVADRVEVHPLDEMLPLALLGPGCEAALARAGSPVPSSPWGNLRATLFGTDVQLSRHDRLGAPAVTVWVPAAVAAETADNLVDALGATPVGDDAAESARIAAGIGRFGVDFGAENLPQEAEAPGAIDFGKGCYLGQEVVARLHYRGQAPRLLRSLALPVDGPPAVGREVRLDGRAAGTITSVARASSGDRRLALAMLQRRATEPGTRVELDDGTPAIVSAPGRAGEVTLVG
jgi:folate-binding protein YgfZ